MKAVSVRIRGRVQGVGFRPFVWRLAQDHGVAGTVRNDGEGVLIAAQGAAVDAFVRDLTEKPPPLARIERVEVDDSTPDPDVSGFEIAATADGIARTRVAPDAVVCAACAADIHNPADRRFGYPFTNCTHCGPRFSIVESIPYDRAATTMKAFAMCGDCRREYDDPADRRFHAQPVACPACGPRAWVEDADGAVDCDDPIAEAARRLRAGEILAVKGIGGFHLACDARNEQVVKGLRARKRRPAKPFALMAPDIATVRRFSRVSEAEARALTDAAAPVVLCEAAGEPLAPSVAPGQWALGWMVPTSPLHLLLCEAFGGPLVMTSGNLSGEPQVIDNVEARVKLGAFVDAYLMHDRPIARRLDDSVVRIAAGDLRVQRRARGFAPETLALPGGLRDAPPIAAYGAFLKSALCLTQDGRALLSHHLGDLDDALTAEEFAKADGDYARLLDHDPAAVACDLHPDYPSTAHAEARAAALNVPLVRVQHHHAHIAAVMAENGWTPDDGPVLGVALDGLGWGPDGTVWGGEFLLCRYESFERLGHLRPVALPGGSAAQRDPWRNLLAQLDAAGAGDAADRLLAGKPVDTLRAMIAKGVNAPPSTSAGRLFDAVAAAVGCAPDTQSFEGEAAMALETLARPHVRRSGGYPFADADGVVDPAPMWAALLADHAAGVDAGMMAARFHVGLARAACAVALRLADAAGTQTLAFSGGCFQNATLLSLCLDAAADTRVLTHSITPPNDGCIALGQAAAAAARARAGVESI
jgi:hydrogenase maturation protein HypF